MYCHHVICSILKISRGCHVLGGGKRPEVSLPTGLKEVIFEGDKQRVMDLSPVVADSLPSSTGNLPLDQSATCLFCRSIHLIFLYTVLLKIVLEAMSFSSSFPSLTSNRIWRENVSTLSLTRIFTKLWLMPRKVSSMANNSRHHGEVFPQPKGSSIEAS